VAFGHNQNTSPSCCRYLSGGNSADTVGDREAENVTHSHSLKGTVARVGILIIQPYLGFLRCLAYSPYTQKALFKLKITKKIKCVICSSS
jgi:hypothetical protein